MVAGVARQRVSFFFSQGVPTSLQNGSQHRLNLGVKIVTKLTKLVPKGSQIGDQKDNRAPEATRVENYETLIFDDSTKDFNDLSCLRAPFWS